MQNSAIIRTDLPPHQQALRAKCFHPTGTFIEFTKEEIAQSIPERFEDQVRKHGHRVALQTRNAALTYAELNTDANRIAHAILVARGERPEQVAVLFYQGIAAIAATLGVLKAGKTYVPLDPAVPHARNNSIIRDARVGFVVADTETVDLADALVHNEYPVLNIDSLESGLATDNPGLRIAPESLSYIMYTSGSTGQPKGVVQNHQNVLYKSRGWINVVHICPEDRLSLLRSLSVSGSIRDLFGGLLSGATVLPFDVKKAGLPHLASWLDREEITIYNSVVTLFRHFGSTLSGEEHFSRLRLIKLSGEPVYKRDIEIYKRYFPADCLVMNMLASAEVGTTRVYFMDKTTPIPDRVVPVGYPLEGCEVLVLDEQGQPLGYNQVGEIAVQSEYLAPGYWHMPDLSAAVFLPTTEGAAARLYRTGDLGRMLPDGCLVHLGRKDAHVKIRGYSVEIAEVEAALSELETTKEVVVTTRENAHGHQSLVAYIVPVGQHAPTINTLRKTLSTTLPDYMIPSAFIFLDALPVTGPGKIDLKALPDPGRSRPDLETPFVSPRTPVETALASIWAEILDVDQVGMHDHFFALGGDSLLASRVISQVIQTLQVDVPLQALFQAPTVAAMAVAVVQTMLRQASPSDIERLVAEMEGLSEAQGSALLSPVDTRQAQQEVL